MLPTLGTSAVSRQTASMWIGRYIADGDQLLYDHSSRPVHVRERVSPQDLGSIWRRRRISEGPLTISWHIIYRIDPDAIVVGEVFQKKKQEIP